MNFNTSISPFNMPGAELRTSAIRWRCLLMALGLTTVLVFLSSPRLALATTSLVSKAAYVLLTRLMIGAAARN